MKKIMILANDTTYTYNLRDEVIERLIEEKYEVIIVAKILAAISAIVANGLRRTILSSNSVDKESPSITASSEIGGVELDTTSWLVWLVMTKHVPHSGHAALRPMYSSDADNWAPQFGHEIVNSDIFFAP